MPGAWYASLNKPAWNPPAWVFGPAWTLLYTLMAVAAWLVWKQDGWRRPLLLYFIQLVLNAAWTPIFFGAHQLGWAMIEMLALWTSILLTGKHITYAAHRQNTFGCLGVYFDGRADATHVHVDGAVKGVQLAATHRLHDLVAG